jgi:glycosyltransferase involved in cell wall biosynthesis
MIIGIDCRTLQDKQYSGVSEYTFQLLSELFKLDRQNQYRLFYNSSHDLAGLIPHFDFANVTVQKFDYPNKLLNYGLLMPLGKPWVDDLMGGVDIFFVPHLNFMAVSHQAKLFLTIHDLSFLHNPEFFSWRKNIWHRCLGVKKLARRADAIIAISQNTKNDIIDLLSVPAEKIQVIFSGIDADIARVVDEQILLNLQTKYSLPETFLLYLGTLEPRKNLPALVTAFELLKAESEHSELHLILAGGDGWKNRELHQQIASSKYASYIKLIGYVERGEKSALYTLARAFVYPSLYEGFGFPPLEAGKCGTPVLTSYSSSLSEILQSETVFVNPFDVNDILSGLREVLTKKTQPTIKTPTWQEAALKYIELFERLANNRPAKVLTEERLF